MKAILLCVIVALAMTSCSSVNKLKGRKKVEEDSTFQNKKDSVSKSETDSSKATKVDLSSKSEKTDQDSNSVIITLDPSMIDSTTKVNPGLLIEIDDSYNGKQESDYADAEVKPGKKWKIKVPNNTTKVEIRTKTTVTNKDSSGMSVTNTSTHRHKDSIGVSTEGFGRIIKKITESSKSVKKRGLTCGGNILLIVIAGLAIFILYRYQRWRKIRDAFKPSG